MIAGAILRVVNPNQSIHFVLRRPIELADFAVVAEPAPKPWLLPRFDHDVGLASWPPQPVNRRVQPLRFQRLPAKRFTPAVEPHGAAIPYRQRNRTRRQAIADDDACASISLLEKLQGEGGTIGR